MDLVSYILFQSNVEDSRYDSMFERDLLEEQDKGLQREEDNGIDSLGHLHEEEYPGSPSRFAQAAQALCNGFLGKATGWSWLGGYLLPVAGGR